MASRRACAERVRGSGGGRLAGSRCQFPAKALRWQAEQRRWVNSDEDGGGGGRCRGGEAGGGSEADKGSRERARGLRLVVVDAQ
jgi:hypothetical protein